MGKVIYCGVILGRRTFLGFFFSLLESVQTASPLAQAVRSMPCSLDGKIIESLSELSSPPTPLMIEYDELCWNGQQW